MFTSKRLFWARLHFLGKTFSSLRSLDPGRPFIVERREKRRAWQLRETQSIMQTRALQLQRVDGCAYRNPASPSEFPQQCTLLLSNAPWLKEEVRRCPRDRRHGSPLQVTWASQASGFPAQLCEQLADVLARWKESASAARCSKDHRRQCSEDRARRWQLARACAPGSMSSRPLSLTRYPEMCNCPYGADAQLLRPIGNRCRWARRPAAHHCIHRISATDFTNTNWDLQTLRGERLAEVRGLHKRSAASKIQAAADRRLLRSSQQ